MAIRGQAGGDLAPACGAAVDDLAAERCEVAGEALLEVRGLRCGYESAEIVHGVSFDVDAGEFLCVIGANGCGKTTTLKTVLGLLPPLGGSVRVHGREVAELTDAERARTFAYIPQAHTPPFPFTVGDVVLLGRTPYLGRASRTTAADRRVAWDAMELLGIEGLAESAYTRLSGGQQQLVLIARALAQEPALIIMDEPTASLDFGNQQVVLSRMKDLSRTGVSVLMVTHDPHHAFYCADRVLVMREGRLIADGAPDSVMTRDRLELIYDTPLNVAEVTLTTGERRRVCVPL